MVSPIIICGHQTVCGLKNTILQNNQYLNNFSKQAAIWCWPLSYSYEGIIYTNHTFYLFHHCWSGMVNLQMTIMHNHYASGYSTVGDAKVVPILDHKLLITELKRKEYQRMSFQQQGKKSFLRFTNRKTECVCETWMWTGFLNWGQCQLLSPAWVMNLWYVQCSFINRFFPSFHFIPCISPCLSSLYYTICKSF